MSATPATVISSDQPLTAAEAEAVATAVVLHHLRAAQGAGGSGPTVDRISPWAREALLTSVDKELHRVTAWGTRTWG
ncbi:MAG: hypothetical protein Q7T55_03285 [Solirubrobacteraceae bacterium]|nr:hypothetical protein [Solirubrobacteraceae bacterium]